jgi:hypothetical protein
VSGQERLARSRTIRCLGRLVLLRRRRVPLRKTFGKCPAHGGRWREHGELGRAALNLVGVVTDDRDPRPRLREAARGVRRLTEGGRADHEDRVVGCESLAQPRTVRRKYPREKSVVLREPCPRTERLLEHRGDEPLGEADEGFPRLGVVRARADDERGCLRALEEPDELLHRCGVGRGRTNDAGRRWVLPLLFGGCAPVVHRHRHEGRAALRLGLVPRPADRAGDVLRANGLLDPDRILAAEPAELAGEEWLEGEVAAILLADEDDERRPVDTRGGERAHRIAQARGGVEEGDCRSSTPDRPTRREPHDRALVEAEHEAQVLREVGQERHLGGAGVAENRRQALLPEDLERRVANRLPAHGAQYHGCRSSV